MYTQTVVKMSPNSYAGSEKQWDINPLDARTPKKGEIDIGDREMRLIPRK
jgi:hypothetical protein